MLWANEEKVKKRTPFNVLISAHTINCFGHKKVPVFSFWFQFSCSCEPKTNKFSAVNVFPWRARHARLSPNFGISGSPRSEIITCWTFCYAVAICAPSKTTTSLRRRSQRSHVQDRVVMTMAQPVQSDTH